MTAGFVIGLAAGIPIGAAITMAAIALTTPRRDR